MAIQRLSAGGKLLIAVRNDRPQRRYSGLLASLRKNTRA
jgi:hypothetical protein